MDAVSSLEDLNKVIRKLAEIYYDWVLSQMAGRPWTQAIFETRYANDGSYWHDKMRVETPDRGVISLRTNDEISLMLGDLNKHRLALGCYSFKLDVTNDKKVKINLGYDPNSAEDPAFFAD